MEHPFRVTFVPQRCGFMVKFKGTSIVMEIVLSPQPQSYLEISGQIGLKFVDLWMETL
jgi:hypothetical protein